MSEHRASVVKTALWHYIQHCRGRSLDESLSLPARQEWEEEVERAQQAYDVLYYEGPVVIESG